MGRNRAPLATQALAEADGILTQRAAAGDVDAFEELYRRHAPAAWRLAHALTGSGHDAADVVSEAFTKVLHALPNGRLQDGSPFLPYLLTAVRTTAIDLGRGGARQQPTDANLDRVAPGDGPSEQAMSSVDAAFVATAFRSLPERWRSVLWLTEVEQVPAREAAALLGTSPNGVAQLAVRARNGLRERFLQAHLRTDGVALDCKATVERLGAYVAGGLAPRDVAKVDQHLAGCAGCRARQAELEDVGGRLRALVVPLPTAAGAMAIGRYRESMTLAPAGSDRDRVLAAWFERAQAPLAVASVALFAAGIIGAGILGQDPGSRAGVPRIFPGLGGATPEAVLFNPIQVSTPIPATPTGNTGGSFGDAPGPLAGLLPEPGADTPADGSGDPVPNQTDPGPLGGETPEAPVPSPPRPVAQASARLVLPLGGSTASTAAGSAGAAKAGETSIGIAAGVGEGNCTGAAFGPNTFGCTPPPATGGQVVGAQIGGSLLPGVKIGLP